MTQPQPSPENAAAAAAAPPEGIATALGRIPSGLFIVTWRQGTHDRGMLASWVMQAGFVPPVVTVAVAPGRDLLAAIQAGDPFVVNVLAEDQRHLLARFGRPPAPGDDPFAGLALRAAPCGAAVLTDAAAWLECVPLAPATAPAAGDHVVVVARVTGAASGGDRAPLVHLRKNGLRY